MRILLLGDYSNYHACLAVGLRRLGHEVAVASDGSEWMNTDTTFYLGRPLSGRAGGALLYLKMLAARQLRGYDVVSIISPSFVMLRPPRLRHLFDRLRRYNGKVFLSAIGTDKAFMDMITAADCPLRYSEFHTSPGVFYEKNKAELISDCRWQQGDIGRLCDYIYDNIDGVTTALYEYHLSMQRLFGDDKLSYVGIPIDMEAVRPLERELCRDDIVNIFLGRIDYHKAIKGTDRMGDVAAAIAREYPDRCKLTIVENIPYKQYVERLREGDLVLDQLYSFTPATNALLAMAAGQAVLSGAEPEYYEFIGERDNRPVINAVPDDEILYDTIKECVLNPCIIRSAGASGRRFVAVHNEASVVARRCIDFWEARL